MSSVGKTDSETLNNTYLNNFDILNIQKVLKKQFKHNLKHRTLQSNSIDS